MQHVRHLVLVALVSCHADDTPPPDAVPPDPACAPELLATPGVTATYYVAIGEPGADNALCDGLAPTDEGGGRCPFRDLDALVARGLTTAKATRIELRAGTYLVSEFGGFEVSGSGASAIASAPDQLPQQLVFDHARIVADYIAYKQRGVRPPPRR